MVHNTKNYCYLNFGILRAREHKLWKLDLFSSLCEGGDMYPLGSLKKGGKNSVAESASELYQLSERRLLAKLVPTFADRGCHMVRVPRYSSRGPGLYSRLYQIDWEVVGLEQGSLSLVSTTEELLESKVETPV
jgi:hypothetical protein